MLPTWSDCAGAIQEGGAAAVEAEAVMRSGALLPVGLTLGRASARGADFVVCFARDRRRIEDMRRRLEAAQGELQQLMRLSTVNMMAGALAVATAAMLLFAAA